MNKNYIQYFLLASAVLFLHLTTFAGDPSGHSKQKDPVFSIPEGVTPHDYQPQTLIIKVKPEFRVSCMATGIAVPALQEAMGKLQVRSTVKLFPNAQPPVQERNALGKLVDLSLIYRVKFNAELNIEEAANLLLATGKIEYVDLDYIYQLSYLPNDPDTSGTKNYYLEITKAYQAWDINKGDTGVVIGIVDSGSDLNHPDLKDNIKKNNNDPVNDIDDDNDGYVDNFTGWDLGGADYNNVVGDNDPNINGGNNGHGSHVSGDASAVTDNNIGVSGIGFKSKLLIVKCAADNDTRGSGGVGYIIEGYNGIVYAADHGAQIINNSWGGTGGGSFGQDVVNYAAINKGCLVVAAAGNDNTELPHFPSAYENVFSIASTGVNDAKSGFSNFGFSIDVCAPGDNIYSTYYDNTYGGNSGTSMASPIAAGAAAIVKAHYPSYTGLQVGEQLRVTCDNIDAKNANYKNKLGGGRINLYKALTLSSPSVRSINRVVTDANDGAYLPGDTIQIFSDFINYLAPTANLTVTLSTLAGATKVELLNNTLDIGAVNTLETVTNLAPFRVVIKNVQENTVVNFKLTYKDGTYNDFQVFTLTVNRTSLNITVNQVSSTATSIGRFGFSDAGASDGLGLVYKGQNLMYEAAYMIGVSETQVSNNARVGGGSADNHFASVQRAKRIAGVADFESKGEFNDSINPDPIQVSVRHREFAWSAAPDDKYIILEYKIFNRSSSPLDNVYAGYFADFDIGADQAAIEKNKGAFDTETNMGYVYETKENGLYAGIKMLTSNAQVTFHGMSNQSTYGSINMNDDFSIADKFTALSTVNGPAPGGDAEGEDVMVSVGSGPFSIAPNDSVIVAYAFIAGDNLEDIKKTAKAAQDKYDSIIPTGTGTIAAEQLSLEQNYPNPATGSTDVSFSLPASSKTKLALYDVTGREVRLLIDAELSSGVHRVPVDVKGLDAGVYLYKLTVNGKELSKRMAVVK